MSKARSPSVEQLTFIFVQAGLASAPVRVRHYPNSVCGNILQRAEEFTKSPVYVCFENVFTVR